MDFLKIIIAGYLFLFVGVKLIEELENRVYVIKLADLSCPSLNMDVERAK